MSAKILEFKSKEQLEAERPKPVEPESEVLVNENGASPIEMALNELKASFSEEELTSMFEELNEIADAEDEEILMEMLDKES